MTSKKYNVAVIGSRNFSEYQIVKQALDKIKHKVNIIVSGGAKGPDSFGEYWANNNSIQTLIFKPNWTKFGKGAGFIRNRHIIENCDVVLAFWDGKSRGTKMSIDLAKKQSKKIFIFSPKKH